MGKRSRCGSSVGYRSRCGRGPRRRRRGICSWTRWRCIDRTVVVTDERAGLAIAAAGQAIVVTADPALTAPGVGRHPLVDNPLPLRLRLVWSRTRTPFLRPADVMAGLTEALVAS